MKKLLPLLAAVAIVPSGTAGENLLADRWRVSLERPATGFIGNKAVEWRSDSVMTMAVRYVSVVDSPSAYIANEVPSPMPRKYRFEAWVNIARAESWLTLSLTDAEGRQYSSISVTTDQSVPGALTAGRWTRVGLEADLSEVASLPSSLQVRLCPQWRGSGAVSTTVIPSIMMSDAVLCCSDATGNYRLSEIDNGNLERWDGQDSGLRVAAGWDGVDVKRVAGAHIVDNAAFVPAQQHIRTVAGNVLAGKYNLTLSAFSPEGCVVNAEWDDAGQQVSVPAALWTPVTVPVTVNRPASLELWADADWVVDDVRLTPVFDIDNPHPVEQTLVVTNGDDDGPGSLRQVLGSAPNHSGIVFDVETVTLASAISLGDKTVTISPLSRVRIQAPDGQPAFNIVPTVDDVTVTLTNLDIAGTGTAGSGGAIAMADSRATSRAHLEVRDVTFGQCAGTGNGGAVYFNSPNVTARFIGCTFKDCRAGSGAAVSVGNGLKYEFTDCVFSGCESTGTIGGALAVNTSSAVVVDVLGCAFDGCRSTQTTSGAGAISVQSAAARVSVGRTLFVAGQGGRGSAVSVYNNARGTVSGYTAVVNCTAVNNIGTSPVMAMGATARYTPPTVYYVNNVVTANESGALGVASGTPVGSNNLLDGCDNTMDNPITHRPDEQTFAFYNGDAPAPMATDALCYPINTRGALYDAGTESFVTTDGSELVSDAIRGYKNSGGSMSVGHTEYNEQNLSVADVAACGVEFWPVPATTTLHVTAQAVDRVWLTSLSGRVVYSGRSTVIDVSALPSGVYMASVEIGGEIITRKIVIQ